jgi:hypothetical protein
MEHPSTRPEWREHSHTHAEEIIVDLLFDAVELLAGILAAVQPAPPGPGSAARLSVAITTKGGSMSPVAVDIVDTDTGAKATASWLDGAGLPLATRPANAAPLVFGSDAPAIATCATDASNPDQGDIAEVALGSFNVTVAAPLDTSGAPLLEADGVTPIPAPAPTAANVVNSPAGGLAVVVAP